MPPESDPLDPTAPLGISSPLDLATALPEPPADSILSRTVHQDALVKVVLFRFAAGQELSEHTAAVPAMLHVLEGRASLGLGGESQEAGPGTWVHMAANLPHSVVAHTPVSMLLTMLRTGKG